MSSPDYTIINTIKDKFLNYLEDIKNTNVTTYLTSNKTILNIVVLYIIYLFTKDILKGLVTAILYTAVVTLTIMYAYKYFNSIQEDKNKQEINQSI